MRLTARTFTPSQRNPPYEGKRPLPGSRSGRPRRGFTLIELLIVIAIIAILGAVIAPNAFRAIEKAKASHLVQNLGAFRTAILAYYADMGFWPPDVGPYGDPGFTTPLPHDARTGSPVSGAPYGLPADWQNTVNARWDGPYLEKMPVQNPWGGSYDYENWMTPLALPDPPGIYLTVRGLPRGVINSINAHKDKFPFLISETVRWTDTITSRLVDGTQY